MESITLIDWIENLVIAVEVGKGSICVIKLTNYTETTRLREIEREILVIISCCAVSYRETPPTVPSWMSLWVLPTIRPFVRNEVNAK